MDDADHPSTESGAGATGALDAGPFAAWRRRTIAVLAGDADADVPCGECTACCRSSQFVHVEPDEVDTLAHVPRALLFPAPGRPAGHLVIGYDEHGRCPLLGDHGCTIYEHRPRTCRAYDCRVFAAADVEPDAHQPAIAVQVRRWRFEHPGDEDRRAHASVLASARRLAAAEPPPPNRLALALRAVADA